MSAPPARRRAPAVLIAIALAAFGLFQATAAQAAPAASSAATSVPVPSAAVGSAPVAATAADDVTPVAPGTPFEVSIPADIGAAESFSFEGTAGQRITISTSITDDLYWQDDGTGFLSLWTEGYGESSVISATGPITLTVSNYSGAPIDLTATLGLVTDVTAPLTVGTTVTRAFTVPGQNVRYTFPGTSGTKLAIRVTAISLSASFTVTAPDGTLVAGLSYNEFGQQVPVSAPTVLSGTLPQTGTYTMTIDPDGADTGSITFSSGNPVDQVVSVTPGKAVAVTYPGDGSDVRLTFQAVLGQRVTLGLTASNLTGAVAGGGDPYTNATLIRPDGTQANIMATYLREPVFAEQSVQDGSAPTSVDVAGTWTLLLHPAGSTQGTQTVNVGLATHTTVPATLGRATTMKVTGPGQNVDYKVKLTAGQTLIMNVGASRLTAGADGGPTTPDVLATLYDSSGQYKGQLLNDYESGQNYAEYQNIPKTDTYTIVMDPSQDTVGTMTLTFRYPKVTTSPLPLGSSTTASMQTGDFQRYTLPATAGQRIGVQVTKLASAPSDAADGLVEASVLAPDGSVLAQQWVQAPGFVETPPVTAKGTYVVEFQASEQEKVYTVAVTFKGSQARDVQGSLTSGQASKVTLGTPGQQAQYTFHAVAGRRVALDVAASSWTSLVNGVTRGSPALNLVSYELIRPDGSTFTQLGGLDAVGSAGGFVDEIDPLDATGTWTLVVDPSADTVGQESLMAYVVQDVTGTTTLGAAKKVKIGTPGQKAFYTFTWDGSDTLVYTATGNTIPSANVTLIPPGSTYGFVGYGLTGPTGTGFWGGDGPGTYTLEVDPLSDGTGATSITLTTQP